MTNFWRHKLNSYKQQMVFHQKPWLTARFYYETSSQTSVHDMEHTYNRWFLTRFREHGIPSTWRENFRDTASVPVSSSLKAKAKGIRIGNSPNTWLANYLILNEIISSTIVYDQDTNRSRRFTLAALGASLNVIAICFIQCFLFVDIWTFTWICCRIQLLKLYS